MEEKKLTRAEKRQVKKEEIESYNKEIKQFQAYIKGTKLPKAEKAFIKKEIRNLKSFRFELKHPVLHFIGFMAGALFEAVNEAGNQIAQETKENYEKLDPIQKAAVFYAAVNYNPIAGVELTNMMGKYNSKKELNGLKEQNKDKSDKNMEY